MLVPLGENILEDCDVGRLDVARTRCRYRRPAPRRVGTDGAVVKLHLACVVVEAPLEAAEVSIPPFGRIAGMVLSLTPPAGPRCNAAAEKGGVLAHGGALPREGAAVVDAAAEVGLVTLTATFLSARVALLTKRTAPRERPSGSLVEVGSSEQESRFTGTR